MVRPVLVEDWRVFIRSQSDIPERFIQTDLSNLSGIEARGTNGKGRTRGWRWECGAWKTLELVADLLVEDGWGGCERV